MANKEFPKSARERGRPDLLQGGRSIRTWLAIWLSDTYVCVCKPPSSSGLREMKSGSAPQGRGFVLHGSVISAECVISSAQVGVKSMASECTIMQSGCFGWFGADDRDLATGADHDREQLEAVLSICGVSPYANR